MAKDPSDRPADGRTFVAELKAIAAGAYGRDWYQRGRSDLGEAALLLAELWPARTARAPGQNGEADLLVPEGPGVEGGHCG